MNEVPNDFESFFAAHTEIKIVVLNGSAAKRLYSRHITRTKDIKPKDLIHLPSTSGTPGKNVLSFEEKVARWTIIRSLAELIGVPSVRGGECDDRVSRACAPSFFGEDEYSVAGSPPINNVAHAARPSPVNRAWKREPNSCRLRTWMNRATRKTRGRASVEWAGSSRIHLDGKPLKYRGELRSVKLD